MQSIYSILCLLKLNRNIKEQQFATAAAVAALSNANHWYSISNHWRKFNFFSLSSSIVCQKNEKKSFFSIPLMKNRLISQSLECSTLPSKKHATNEFGIIPSSKSVMDAAHSFWCDLVCRSVRYHTRAIALALVKNLTEFRLSCSTLCFPFVTYSIIQIIIRDRASLKIYLSALTAMQCFNDFLNFTCKKNYIIVYPKCNLSERRDNLAGTIETFRFKRKYSCNSMNRTEHL